VIREASLGFAARANRSPEWIMTTIKGAAFAIGLALVLIISAPSRAVNAQNIQFCGNEGESPCAGSLFNSACDTGLKAETNICGCALRGPFGICLFPKLCTTCENDTRHQAGAAEFPETSIAWALKNQRDLSQDEPINWVMQLGSHNSFNSHADGHRFNFPNHFYSISDQLESGARFLSLDVHNIPEFEGPPRLCHGGEYKIFDFGSPGILCKVPSTDFTFPGMRHFSNGIKEISNWLDENLTEIIIVGLEDYVGTDTEGGAPGDVRLPINTYFGARILPSTLAAPAGHTQVRWPTRREMLAAGRQVIVSDDSGISSTIMFNQNSILAGTVADWKALNQRRFPNCVAATAFTAAADTDVFSPGDGLDTGDRVQFATSSGAALPGGVSANTAYYVRKTGSNFRISETSGGAVIDVTTDGQGSVRLLTRSRRFSVLAEDRSGITAVFPEYEVGELDVPDIADAAACNVNLIALDYFSSLPSGSKTSDIHDFDRQAAAVWSWKPGEKGQNGACALFDGADGRWSSANCALSRRFACGRPRSESSLDPLDWTDPLGEDWKITAAAGPWTDGEATCRAEFPGYTFGVPVNGYQNRKLRGVDPDAADLWLNYSRRLTGNRWVIGRLTNVNSPPAADAGPDQTIECGSSVTLNGSGSSDPDGDTLTYTWTGSFGTLTGAVVTTTLARGTHAVLLTVSDGKGGTDTDEVTITVRDTTAPSLSVALTPSVLWPANHRLVDIVASIQVSDGCDSDPLVELVSITSSEPAEMRGAGSTDPDVLGAETGTDDRQFNLRAERSGRGIGRTYTVTYRATDASGNKAEVTAQVLVPHDTSAAPPRSRGGSR
jgi:hypothetical protein